MGQIRTPPLFINKALMGHSYTVSDVLSLAVFTQAELKQQRFLGHRGPKILTIWSHTERTIRSHTEGVRQPLAQHSQGRSQEWDSCLHFNSIYYLCDLGEPPDHHCGSVSSSANGSRNRTCAHGAMRVHGSVVRVTHPEERSQVKQHNRV